MCLKNVSNVVVTLCSITLKVLAASYSFLQLMWLILRALALVPRKVLKNAKNRTFALKIALFSLKTGAKAHTQLQQGKTSMHKCFPVKKYTI